MFSYGHGKRTRLRAVALQREGTWHGIRGGDHASDCISWRFKISSKRWL